MPAPIEIRYSIKTASASAPLRRTTAESSRKNICSAASPVPSSQSSGADPLLFLASCVEGTRYGQSELDWAGGVRGAPIEVIHGELTGLPIPAHAEIALEGFITTDEFTKEGPYGEWMGYYQDGYHKDRVVRIHRIYHRERSHSI